MTALALWLTTLIVGGTGDRGIWIEPYSTEIIGVVFTFVLVALIFAIVNATLGAVVRFVSIPLKLLTLGLFSLIVNGFLLMVVGWFSSLIGFGLNVDGFWWAVLGSIVLSLFTVVLNAVLGTSKRKR